MRFKSSFTGYLMLGFAFFLFVGIPFAFLLNTITMMTLLGGVIIGNIWVLLVLAILLLVLGFAIMGWLVFRFVKTNQFG